MPLKPGSSLLHLTTLPPFTSRTLLVVVPSVYLLAVQPAQAVLDQLVPSPAEVSAIFHVNLQDFLGLPNTAPTPTTTHRTTRSSAAAIPLARSTLTHSYQDFVWLSERLYRLHAFSHSTIPSPVTGLTADILITTALVAHYALTEDALVKGVHSSMLGFELHAEGQMLWSEILHEAMRLQGTKGLGDARTSIR